jgi:hypothetical protein
MKPKIEFSKEFKKRIKAVDSVFFIKKLKLEKVGSQFLASFDLHSTENKLVIDTTITRSSLINLENRIIEFISENRIIEFIS